jgi:hypothetical protein
MERLKTLNRLYSIFYNNLNKNNDLNKTK